MSVKLSHIHCLWIPLMVLCIKLVIYDICRVTALDSKNIFFFLPFVKIFNINFVQLLLGIESSKKAIAFL